MPIFKLLGLCVLMLGLASCTGSRFNEAASPGTSTAKPGSVEDFNINVGDRVFFETDQASLTGASKSTLQRQAAWLKQYSHIKVMINGHADERGTREYNIALGARRASTVRAYLISLGVQTGRVRTISYGKERPVATCDNISCWSQNRRAQTMVTNSAGS